MIEYWYKVTMTIERVVKANDEDHAIEIAKEDFEYSDINHSDFEVEEI
mgnify:CR=1 FL=1|jgi:hypothetical protein